MKFVENRPTDVVFLNIYNRPDVKMIDVPLLYIFQTYPTVKHRGYEVLLFDGLPAIVKLDLPFNNGHVHKASYETEDRCVKCLFIGTRQGTVMVAVEFERSGNLSEREATRFYRVEKLKELIGTTDGIYDNIGLWLEKSWYSKIDADPPVDRYIIKRFAEAALHELIRNFD